MLVEKFGTEIVSRKDNRFTNPVFFAAQQGEAYKLTDVAKIVFYHGVLGTHPYMSSWFSL